MPQFPTPSTLVAMAVIGLTIPASLSAADYYVYYGSPNGGATNGLYLGHFDSDTGVLTTPKLAAQAEGPSFFTIAADGKHLYTCYEKAGKVAAYAIDAKTGDLKLLDVQSSGGQGPCHISLDKTNHFAFVANYDSGSVAVLPIKDDGSLGEIISSDQHKGGGVNPTRQEGPHAHCVIVDPSNKFVLCTDLGNDKIYVYPLNKDGTLAAEGRMTGVLKPGSGPRHLLFNPNGKVLYCINEMGGSVTAFNWDGATGALTEFQTISTLPADFKDPNTDAELAIHPNGKFLYASARGHDSVAVFSIDPKTSGLTLVQDAPVGGKTPRYIGFDPSGKWMIAGHQGSDTAVIFSVDAKTGQITPKSGSTIKAPAPICMLFLPVPGK